MSLKWNLRHKNPENTMVFCDDREITFGGYKKFSLGLWNGGIWGNEIGNHESWYS